MLLKLCYDDEELQAIMALNIEYARLAYGEQIVRGTNLPPTEVEEFLCMDGDVDAARQWLSFAYAAQEGDEEAVRGLLIYMCSNSTDKVDRSKRAWLLGEIDQKAIDFRSLTMEKIVGTHLNWSHVFQLVGKEFNPTREKDRIKSIHLRLAAQDNLERETA